MREPETKTVWRGKRGGRREEEECLSLREEPGSQEKQTHTMNNLNHNKYMRTDTHTHTHKQTHTHTHKHTPNIKPNKPPNTHTHTYTKYINTNTHK